MYAVVGCSECSALWVVEGRPETSECPRCGTRRQYARRKKFVTSDDADEAREARARLLAERQDRGEAFASVDSFATLGERVEEAGVDDETYLEGAGLDADAVAEAGERAMEASGSKSRKERVREAVREVDEATEEAVVDYAAERGVDAEYTRKTLEKLVRAGEATENRGTYRLL